MRCVPLRNSGTQQSFHKGRNFAPLSLLYSIIAFSIIVTQYTMSSILASNIPDFTPLSKIEHFFSFCGKIERIKSYDLSKGEDEQCVQVYFANPSAVSTALLLNGAELDGKAVVVREFNDGNIPHEGVKSGGHAGEIAERQGLVEKTTESDSEKSPVSSVPGDIEQEHKPKSAIFAEYLAQGYVLGDHLISKALDYDKKNGYSEKFNKFLADLDAKYKIQEKSKEIDAKIDETQKGLDSKYKISESLNKYFEKAQKTELGGKIIDFYTKTANDAREVHEEAKRLAELKKGAPITNWSHSDSAKAHQASQSVQLPPSA